MKGIKDEHYEDFLMNPEYCGRLLRRKAFHFLVFSVALGDIILIISWLCQQ